MHARAIWIFSLVKTRFLLITVLVKLVSINCNGLENFAVRLSLIRFAAGFNFFNPFFYWNFWYFLPRFDHLLIWIDQKCKRKMPLSLYCLVSAWLRLICSSVPLFFLLHGKLVLEKIIFLLANAEKHSIQNFFGESQYNTRINFKVKNPVESIHFFFGVCICIFIRKSCWIGIMKCNSISSAFICSSI